MISFELLASFMFIFFFFIFEFRSFFFFLSYVTKVYNPPTNTWMTSGEVLPLFDMTHH